MKTFRIARTMNGLLESIRVWERLNFCRDENGQAHFPDRKLESGELQ